LINSLVYKIKCLTNCFNISNSLFLSIANLRKYFFKFNCLRLTTSKIVSNFYIRFIQSLIIEKQQKYRTNNIKQLLSLSINFNKNKNKLYYCVVYRFIIFVFCISTKILICMRNFLNKLNMQLIILLIIIEIFSCVTFAQKKLRLEKIACLIRVFKIKYFEFSI